MRREELEVGEGVGSARGWSGFLPTALLLLMVASGCATLRRGERPVPPPASITVDGVTYRAESYFAADSVLWIKTRVIASNELVEGVSKSSYGACLPAVRVYGDRRRVDNPVWSEPEVLSPPGECDRRGRSLSLAPGEERQLHLVAVAPRRLNALLTPRRYYFSVTIWLDGRAYEVAAGQDDLSSDHGLY